MDHKVCGTFTDKAFPIPSQEKWRNFNQVTDQRRQGPLAQSSASGKSLQMKAILLLLSPPAPPLWGGGPSLGDGGARGHVHEHHDQQHDHSQRGQYHRGDLLPGLLHGLLSLLLILGRLLLGLPLELPHLS